MMMDVSCGILWSHLKFFGKLQNGLRRNIVSPRIHRAAGRHKLLQFDSVQLKAFSIMAH